ncbi:MAG: exosortase/archaeosortase family protein [Planctomycetota bacterium]|jgi:exosortase
MISYRSSPALISLLFLALFALLTWPVWRWLGSEWWSNPSYSHGFLIPLVAAYLAWRSWPSEKLEGDNRGLVLTAFGLALFLFFLANKATWLAALSMTLVLGGVAWTFGGLVLLRRLAFPIAFLVLMVPLPFIERTTLPLALWTGICSGWLTQALGLDVAVTGNAVTLPNTDLVIGAQCSGINSIVSLLTLTVLLAYVLKGPLLGRLALVAMAIPLAMLANILRVSTLLFVARYFGAEAAFHFYHDYSGPIYFGVALLLLIPLARLFRCQRLRFELL